MKHFVSVGLLLLSLGVAGCVGYRPATSPYYTTYYNTFDATRNCYYHTRYYGGYGYIGGGHGRNRWQPGSGGHEHHGGGGHDHHSGSGSSHSGSSGHSHGSSHSGSSHSGGSHK